MNTPKMSNKDYAIFKLVGLLFSHKFIVLTLAVAVSFGLRLPAEVHAAILLVAGVTFSILKYLEDKAKAGQPLTAEEIIGLFAKWLDSLPDPDATEPDPTDNPK